MKQFVINLAIVMLSIYAVICFISFTPHPLHWDVGGRGAFMFFSLFLSVVVTSIQEAESDKKLNRF
jgi:hypothetical protein